MKSRPSHISLLCKTFLLLASVSVAAFVFVLLLATSGIFDRPDQVVFVTAGALTFVSIALLVGIWWFLLRPVSALAQKLEESGIDRHGSTDPTGLRNVDILTRIEDKTAELSQFALASELAAKRSEGIFSQIILASRECICRIDADGGFQYCDPEFVVLLGYHSSAELISANKNSFANLIQDRQLADTFLARMVEKSRLTENQIYLRHRQDARVCVDLCATAIRNHSEDVLYFQINLSDVSKLSSSAMDLEKTRLFQQLFGGLTNLLLLAKDEAELTVDFCRLLVEKGNYDLAWIGAGLEGDDKSARPLAARGQNLDNVQGPQKLWASGSTESGPVFEAMKSGQPIVIRDITVAEELVGSNTEEERGDINALLAIPLRVDHVVSSALVIYSSSANAFADHEISWLADLANSMSMGVGQLRDRKVLQRAEKARSRAERKYREIFDNAAEGMIQLSPDQHIINANLATARILGYKTIEDLLREGNNIGKNLLAKQAHAAEISGGENDRRSTVRHEIRWTGANQKQIWLTTNLQPGFDKQGRITRYDGVLVDVTAQRETEIDLRKLSRAVEQSPVAVIITDLDGNIEYVNKKFTIVSGFTLEEVLGKKPNILKSGHTSDAEYADLWRIVSSGGEWQGEFHNRKKNGELFWEAASISPIRDAQGRVTHYLAVKEDITEAKAADEAYRQTGAHLETILNNVAEGIVSADEDGEITGFNAAAEKMFGYRPDEAIGQNIAMLGGEGDLGGLHTRIVDSFKFEQNSPFFGHIIEVTGRRSDGTQFPMEISVSIAIAAESRVFLGTYRDISERKEIERERSELGERLVNSERLQSVGELAGGIAHDFNNILTPIVGYVELAKRSTEEGSQVHKDLLRIERSAHRARELTTKILNFSRPASSEVQPTAFDEIIAEAVDMIRIAVSSDIDVSWLNRCESAVVLGDPSQLSQIAMNLVTNAQQALADSRGQITVRLDDVSDAERLTQANLKYQTGSFIRLRVEDTGPGMDENTRAKISEPFFTTKPTGTGLGMATVLSIVNGLDGALVVESQPGVGTAVDVYLPSSAAHVDQNESATNIEDPVEGHEHVMFVDDEPEHTDMARRMLENFGYVVTPMTDSELALEEFKARPRDFDIVITDQMMPKLSGHELALAMWEIRPDLPIVAISGYSKNVSARNAQKLGYIDFLAKPFDLRSLNTIVRRSLDDN
jgi:PAS domain S-box-containing protein